MSVNSTAFHQLPDAIGCQNVSTDHRPRLLTPVVGPLKRSFSGISWYLARAAMAEKVLDGAFALTTDATFNMRLRARGALWKLLQFLQGRNTRGYKYDPTFSDTVWSQYLNSLADTVIINNCQVLWEILQPTLSAAKRNPMLLYRWDTDRVSRRLWRSWRRCGSRYRG